MSIDHRNRETTTSGRPLGAQQVVDPRTGMLTDYVILKERSKWVRSYRDTYKHRTCGAITMMSKVIAETFACDPQFYSHTFCIYCKVGS